MNYVKASLLFSVFCISTWTFFNIHFDLISKKSDARISTNFIDSSFELAEENIGHYIRRVVAEDKFSLIQSMYFSGNDPSQLDLALIKEVDSVFTDWQMVEYGDTVKFLLTVFNQDCWPATSIILNDYLPVGYSFIRDTMLNPGWKGTGISPETIQFAAIDSLPGFSDTTICLYTLLESNLITTAATEYLNFAEIFSARDTTGKAWVDFDSEFNSNTPEELAIRIHEPGDDDTMSMSNMDIGADDDHDVGGLFFYDLALIKTTSESVVAIGDTVAFDIQVINQSNIPATNIEVIDYIPESFNFIDDAMINPGWQLSGADAIFRSVDSLPIAGDTTIQIRLIVDSNLTEYGLVNFAEIYDSDEYQSGWIDADSEPADNSGMFMHNPEDNPDPNGGNPFDDSDNEIFEQAKLGGDSDDHDGAYVVVCQPYACKSGFNAALNSNCEFVFHPAQFLRSFPIPRELAKYKVEDQFKHVYNIDRLTDEFIGQCLNVSISVPICGINSCWLKICVDNKFPPYLACENDTIMCHDPLPGLPEPGLSCSQSYEIKVASQRWHGFDCDQDTMFEGFHSRVIQVKDSWGQLRECLDTVWVLRVDMDSLYCPEDVMLDCCAKGLDSTTNEEFALLFDEDYVEFDEEGYPHPKVIIDKLGNSVGLVDPPYLVNNLDTSYLVDTKGHCQIVTNYHDHLFPGCGGSFKIRRTWEISNWCDRDTVCVQWIKVVDTVAPQVDSASLEMMEVYTDYGDCAATFELSMPAIKEECSLKFGAGVVDGIKGNFRVEIPKMGHPGQIDLIHGQLTVGERTTITLPAGVHTVEWNIRDDCWQSADWEQTIHVLDITPPNPVCDFEHTLTLDPNQCWGRVYASSLDDGSFDNCCEELHFAAARMSDIIYWRNQLAARMKSCYGETNYAQNRKVYEAVIEQLIGWYVFDDYVDVVACGEEMLVFRVYQACGVPAFDPHVFGGTEHEWYNYQAYSIFADLWNRQVRTIEGADSCAVIDSVLSMEAVMGMINPLYADCMVTLHKADKAAPTCMAAPDITLYKDGVFYADSVEIDGVMIGYERADSAHHVMCTNASSFPWDGGVHGYHSGPLMDGMGGACANGTSHPYITAPQFCRLWLLLDQNDTNMPVEPDQYFSTPVIVDACPDQLTIDSVDSGPFDLCGDDVISRTWIITDACGNETRCTQTMTLLYRSDYEVIFPADTAIACEDTAGLSSGLIPMPMVSDNEIEDINTTYKDELLVPMDGCAKILRTWKVVNWCNYDPDYAGVRYADIIVDDRLRASDDRYCVVRHLKDAGDGVIEYTQVIKIIDEEEPVISCAMSPGVVNNEQENCEPVNVSFVLGTASDNCTEISDIEYSYRYRDTSLTNWNGPVSGNQFNEDLMNGFYEVEFMATDRCGNADTCTLSFAVLDTKAPQAFCDEALATVVMDASGSVEVHASIFDAGSFDNCTASGDLRFAFSNDIADSVRTFTCLDIPDGISQEILLDFYVFDESGNVGSCTDLTLDLQDNGPMEGCVDAPPALVEIEGRVITELEDGVEEVEVSMTSFDPSMTNTTGQYKFKEVPANKAYDIIPYHDKDHLNGVSTLDLVGIQKHILGVQKLNSPYRLIAADVNNSGNISALDIVELRKLILGTYDKIPNNRSWRFVDGTYEFEQPDRPWDYPEEIHMDHHRMHGAEINFVGVKIGDVNGTVTPHRLAGSAVRSDLAVIKLGIDDQTVVTGETYAVPIRATKAAVLGGFQFTLDLGGLEYESIEGQRLTINSDQIGMRYVTDGLITMSWHRDVAVEVEEGEILFKVVVKAKQAGRLSEHIRITSDITQKEWYDGHLDIHDLAIEWTGDRGTMKVYQNRPNPFMTGTLIQFELPQADQVTVNIYDNQARLVKSVQGNYGAGIHELSVSADDLAGAGVYHYEVKTDTEMFIKKMILIK